MSKWKFYEKMNNDYRVNKICEKLQQQTVRYEWDIFIVQSICQLFLHIRCKVRGKKQRQHGGIMRITLITYTGNKLLHQQLNCNFFSTCELQFISFDNSYYVYYIPVITIVCSLSLLLSLHTYIDEYVPHHCLIFEYFFKHD